MAVRPPVSARRPHRFWSRLHFLIRFLGLTGALVGCAGLVLAGVNGELAQYDSWVAVRDAVQPILEGQPTTLGNYLILGGAAAVLFALLVEAVGVLVWTAGRRSAFGFNALLQAGLAAALLVGVNLLSFQHYLRLDWTRGEQFTLPEDVRDQLAQLDPGHETRVIVYLRHKTFGTLTDQPPDDYDSAAERKVVEKVKDLADQLREVGPQLEVEVLDVQDRHKQERLDELSQGAPELRKAIEAAPENTLFFYAKGEDGKAHVQSLSFNDFYLLDKTASQEDRSGRGNLVLLYQGMEPFARRILNLEEKKPRIGIAVIHKVLTTTGNNDLGLQGLRKALEARGFEVEDIVLKKKWSRFAPPQPAADTAEESALERLKERETGIERLIATLERERPLIEKNLTVWKKAAEDQKTRDDLTRQFGARLRGGKVTAELARAQAKIFQAAMEDLDEAMQTYRQRLAEVHAEKDKLNVAALEELQREPDVRAKLARHLADCDLLLIPRMTLRNTAEDFENIPAHLYKLDDAQVEAVKDCLKKGKPVLACLGPINEAPDERRPAEDPVDGLETLLGQLGIKLGKQTVLFDEEVESFADARAGTEIGGGVQADIPVVLLDWQPGAGRPPGYSPPGTPNPIRESLRLVERALGRDAEGKHRPLDLRIRHPRPIWYEPPRNGGGVAFDADFLMTSPRSWNEDQPFPTAESIPQFQKPKGRDEEPKPAEASTDPLEARRRGPFPIGVAIETKLPASWYASAADRPARVRLAVIGQGGFFTGKALPPPQEKLIVNTANWLLGRDDRLPKDDHPWSYPRVNDTIPPDSQTEYLWLWGTRLGLPVLFAYLGLVVLLVRRLR